MAMPLVVTALSPEANLIPLVSGTSLVFIAPLGGLAARAGVRVIGPFLDPAKFDRLLTSRPGRHTYFLSMDVALSCDRRRNFPNAV